jgi:hypothetical protein
MSSTADDIAIKLGIRAGDLKAALTDANAEIRKFGQSGSDSVGALEKVWEKLGHRVVGTRELAHAAATALGLNIEKISSHVAELITGISEQSAKAYEKLGDLSTELTNKQIDAMRRLTSLENQITLTQNDRERSQTRLNEARAAEAAQISTTRILLTGLISPATALVEMVQRRHAIEKSLTEQVDQTLALTRATAEEDRLRTEEKKKQEQLSKIILDYNREEENHAAAINGYEAKVAALQHNLVEAKTALAAAEKGSLEQGKLVLEVQKARFAVDDAILAHKKQIAGSAAEELEVLKLVHKVTSGIATGPEEARLKQINLIRQGRAVELELVDLTNKAVAEKLTPSEQKRFTELLKQQAKLTEQINIQGEIIARAAETLTAEQQVTTELEKQVIARRKAAEAAEQLAKWDGAGMPLGLKGLSDVATDVLAAKLQQLQKQADGIRANFRSSFSTPNVESDFGFVSVSSQLAAVRAELAFRSGFISANAAGGRAGALGAFAASGNDPLAFDRAYGSLQSWNTGQASTTQQLANVNNSLSAINSTLGKVFPGQATAVTPTH